jgi:hypothetical protein
MKGKHFLITLLLAILLFLLLINWTWMSRFLDEDFCLDRGGRVAGDMCELGDGRFIPL